MQSHQSLSRAEYERDVDVTLAGSFPASDPPSWTLGASPWMALGDTVIAAPVPAAVDVIVGDSYRFAGIRLASLGEAIMLSATVPLALLLVGVPVIVLLRGLANAIAWLIASR